MLGFFSPRTSFAACTDSTYTDIQSCVTGGGRWLDGSAIDNAKNNISALNPTNMIWDYFTKSLGDIFASILYFFLTIVSFVLYATGKLLDFILRYTILDLKIHIDQLTGINVAWKVIKDLMNIAFIFILVYKGIELIIGAGSRESIKKFISALVLAALLVNFSLFFTKVLIDASNIVTIGFYKTIIQSGGAPIPINGPTGQPLYQAEGISIPFMKNLGLSTFYSKGSFDSIRSNAGGNWNMVILPLMGIFLFMITAFVFTAVAIIFVIRYITLIILLVLSPIAYMGSALPGFGSSSKEWWDTLTGQLIFGPLYMIMTWIVLTLMSTAGFIVNNTASWGDLVSGMEISSNVPYEQSPISLVFNFVMLIGLVIASLLISKSAASRGSKFVGKAVGSASGMASSAVFGGTAWAGRKSFGNAGRMIADNATLQERADKGGTFSRLALYGAKKARSATYDTRNASIPTSVIGDAIEGTVGRTGFGKAMGLNDVNMGSIPVMAGVSGAMGAGSGGTKSVMDERKESAKRVSERDTANKNELAQAVAKRDIVAGSQANASVAEIEKMEQALSKMSDKQVETLVSNNKDLLDKLNFANSISVKQLEAINKSDQFSDSEKSLLKDARFQQIKTIYDPTALMAYNKAETVRAAGGPLTPADNAALKLVDDARARVRGLSDSELEMVDPNYLDISKPEALEFISNLKSGQADTIMTNKGGKFTATQVANVKKQRSKPLMNALSSGVAKDVKKEIRGADIKTMVSYMRTNGPSGKPIALDPNVLDTYNIKTLQRMALHENMTDGDISTLRDELLKRLPAGNSVRKWLEDPDKGGVEFPA